MSSDRLQDQFCLSEDECCQVEAGLRSLGYRAFYNYAAGPWNTAMVVDLPEGRLQIPSYGKTIDEQITHAVESIKKWAPRMREELFWDEVGNDLAARFR